jgi:hypothetical protein
MLRQLSTKLLLRVVLADYCGIQSCIAMRMTAIKFVCKTVSDPLCLYQLNVHGRENRGNNACVPTMYFTSLLSC